MSTEPTILINLLKAKPGQHAALFAILKETTDLVIRTLPGWKTTRLICAMDGSGVAIYSEWETPAAIESMRVDPRMTASFPRIAELASLESMAGSATWGISR